MHRDGCRGSLEPHAVRRSGPATHPYTCSRAARQRSRGATTGQRLRRCFRIESGDIVEMSTFLTSSPDRLERAGIPPEQVEPAMPVS